MQENLGVLITETNNERTRNIDSLSTFDMLKLINEEDRKVIDAVEAELSEITKVVDKTAEAFRNGGRLIYCGAGTSGRLGVLDASECPPTFGTAPEMVQGFIAGGDHALRNPIEGAEDSFEGGVELAKEINITSNDVVVGIAASGRTKYALGVIDEAKKRGAFTVGICNNPDTLLHKVCDVTIAPVSGPEVVQGSTRLKAGTAQKLVLNMITTGSMIKVGKVYKNYMVDMRASNEKLYDRAKRLLMQSADVSDDVALKTLEQCNYHVKTAIVMIKNNCDAKTAAEALEKAEGYVAKAIGERR